MRIAEFRVINFYLYPRVQPRKNTPVKLPTNVAIIVKIKFKKIAINYFINQYLKIVQIYSLEYWVPCILL